MLYSLLTLVSQKSGAIGLGLLYIGPDAGNSTLLSQGASMCGIQRDLENETSCLHLGMGQNSAVCRRHKQPKLTGALKIYEAHVGLSSEDAVVATYTHFKGALSFPPGLLHEGCLHRMLDLESPPYGTQSY